MTQWLALQHLAQLGHAGDGGIPDDGLKLLIDQAKRDAKITRDVPLSEVADFTLLREVQKELGLR